MALGGNGGGEGIVSVSWSTPAETRWALLNWPGWARQAVLASFFAALNWLIFAPADSFKEVDELFAHQDKIAHGLMFLLLTCLARWSSPAGAARVGVGRFSRYGVPAALLLHACSAEVLQPLIGGKGRQFEWLDMASNITGLFLGWLFFGAAIAGPRDCSALAAPASRIPCRRGRSS